MLSVRSGAPASMPGMMDTVLNLGLNDTTVRGLAESTRDERFARDAHRRFIQAFGEIVLKAPGHLFEDAIEDMGERGVEADTELTAEDLEELAGRFKGIAASPLASVSPWASRRPRRSSRSWVLTIVSPATLLCTAVSSFLPNDPRSLSSGFSMHERAMVGI